MALFTIDIKGRPVLVFSSRDRDAVGEVLAAAVSGDLAVLGPDGGLIWDGESQLVLREARPEEASRWGAGSARAAVRVGDSAVVFLVEVIGPTGEEEEDERP